MRASFHKNHKIMMGLLIPAPAFTKRQRTNGLLKALAMHYSSFTIGHTHCVKRFRI
jgi:hypothetical protein